MNSFQSTSINVNLFTGTVTTGRLAFGGAAANPSSPVNNAVNPDTSLDANRVALGRMREALLGEGIQLSSNAQPRSATDVATQVLKRVSTALDAAPDNASRIALLEKAAKGITQGIAEARQILGEAGALNGKVAETVDAIAEQLQAGLQELAANIVPAVPVNNEVVPAVENAGTAVAPLDPTSAAGRQVSIGAGQLVQRSASISIETQDGDIITLDFNRSEATAVATSAQTGADGTSASFAAVRVVSSDLSYSVQGELDEDEVEALNELLGNISQVADKFFGGQVVAAFQKAANLELDTEELSSYSIVLENTVVQQVVSSYQKVAELGSAETAAGNTSSGATSATTSATPAPSEPNTATPGIADAAVAVGEVAQVVDLAAQQRIIADPQTVLPNLVETVARAKGFDASIAPAGQSFADALGLLRGLIADLVLPATQSDAASNEVKHDGEQEEDHDDE